MKLRTRLLSLLFVTSIVPLLVFSAISVSSFISDAQQNAYQLSQDKAITAEAQIQGMLKNDFTTLRMVATSTSVRTFNLAEAKKELVEAQKVNPDLIIALDNAQGQQVVKSNNDVLTKINDREFFQQSMKGTDEYVSDVLVAKATGALIVVISTPVRDSDNGKIVGVLQANIELTQVSDFVKSLSKNGSTVYVLSRQGKVLAHPNEQYVKDQTDFSKLAFVKMGLAGKDETLFSTNAQGQKVIVSDFYDSLAGWLITVETPYSVAMASGTKLLYTSIGILLAVIILVGLFGFYFAKRFTKPFISLSSVVETIANGDLKDFELEIKSQDEIGLLYKSFKTMNQNLRELVSNIQSVAATLASSSEELTATSEETAQSLTQVVVTINDMAQGNSNQTKMIEDSNNAINRVSRIVSQAAEMTNLGAMKAQESLALAQDGQKTLEIQGQKMQENNKITETVGNSILQLATMTNEISNIIGAINGIAEQTNLLALNASIEAARAGDAGRGFAVVAEEIRKLAEQSSNSTKEIERIVNGINGKVNEAVNNMSQAKEIVLDMNASAENTKESFSEIFASISELVKNSQEVSSALEEVNAKTKEVSNETSKISAVVELTSAGAQEISASSEEQLASIETVAQSSSKLAGVAQELISQVSKFKVH